MIEEIDENRKWSELTEIKRDNGFSVTQIQPGSNQSGCTPSRLLQDMSPAMENESTRGRCY